MDKNTNIVSPITNGSVKFLFDIHKNVIISSYKAESKIDVSYLFEGTELISIFECCDTGYRFFFPFKIDGDSAFYEKLEEVDWYYSSWKWDYEIAIKFIKENSKVLDIGCGEGKFLNFLKKNKNCDCTGLELNQRAKKIAVENGLNVSIEFIQEHVLKNKEKYDFVTFFQVLEHISEVGSFLESAVNCLKKGGKIILAVPNNEPYYLTFDKFHFLNLPPHHMGWWNEQSLSSLAQHYNLKLDVIIKQPLEHFTAYTNSYLDNKFPNLGFFKPLLFPIFKLLFFVRRNSINGASILAVYTKP